MNFTAQLKLWIRYHRVTATLIAISLIVALISNIGSNFQFIRALFISEYQTGLSEIYSGQVWRLFTPAFIHFGIMHIAYCIQLIMALSIRERHRATPKL